MKPLCQALLVAAGYLAAWLVADRTAAGFDARLTAADPANASGGMAAFGVMMFFLQVFAVLALLPTALGLWFLRSCPTFWETGSRCSRYLAATGLAALLGFVPIMQLNRLPAMAKNQWLGLAFLLVGVRLVGALGCGAVATLGMFLSPLPEPRRRFRHALITETVAFLVGFGLFLWWARV